MKLEIDREERELLASLVENRISELHPEIRRSVDHICKDGLKHLRERFETRLKGLRDAGG